MDRWSIAHRYNKLAQAGAVKHLTADDGEVYILKANSEFEPCYWRMSDGSVITPGLDFWSRLRDAVDRADLDNLAVDLIEYN